MLWSGPLSNSALAELTGAGPMSVCEDCIRDVTPPTITSPASIGVEAGTPIEPAEATASEHCDAHPAIFMAMSAPVPTISGDVTTITYTAIDASCNEASRTSEVVAYEPPPPDPANKTDIIGGTCVVTATPGIITTGGTLTLHGADLSYQSNDWVEVRQHVYRTDPSAPGGQLERFVGSDVRWSSGVRSGPSSSWNTVVLNNELFGDQLATVTIHVVARDADTNELLKTWMHSTTVAIRPAVTQYCGQPIEYWANAF